ITIDPLIYVEEQRVGPTSFGTGDSTAGDHFGSSVAIAGETALVGAPYDRVGGHESQGSVYVFVRDGFTWVLRARLTASDGAAMDQSGGSGAVSGDAGLVGAEEHGGGAAYVFVRSGTTWTQQTKLTAGGASSVSFGQRVALEGDTALVGAPYDGAIHQGTAYV